MKPWKYGNKPKIGCDNIGCQYYVHYNSDRCSMNRKYKDCELYADSKFKFRNRNKGLNR